MAASDYTNDRARLVPFLLLYLFDFYKTMNTTELARLRLTGIINYMSEIQKPDPVNLEDHYPTLLAALRAAESRRQADAVVITELAKQAMESLS